MARLFRLKVVNHHLLVTLLERLHHRVKQPAVILCRHFQLVDDKFDRMVAVTVKPHPREKLHYFPVDPDGEIPLLHQILKKLLVMPLAVMHQRGQQVYLTVVILLENQFNDFLGGIFHHRFT